jgi:flagellar hook-associated protein 3 FlgL
MPSLPISTVRTSTPLSTHRLISQLNFDQLAIQAQFDQLSTGRRVQNFSDDPAAAARALGLQRGINIGSQLIRNANSTASFYAATDSSLARVDTALIEARAATVEAAQTVIDDDQRAALATTIRESIQAVLASGNTLFRDHQMLGGILNDGNPFSYQGQQVLYRGTNAVGRAQLGAGESSPINIAGHEALGAFAVVMEGGPLNAVLTPESRLIDLRQGAGVQPGILSLSGGGQYVDLDLRNAATIGDVLSVVEAVKLEGRQLTTSLTNDGIVIEYADGLPGTLAIRDAAGSSMADQLSISNTRGVPTSPVTGDRLSPRVTPLTRIADLPSANGFDLSAGIQIQQGDEVFAIEFNDANTISDVLIAINRSGADVHAELDETQGRIQIRALRSGVDYGIGENGGLAATALGIRSATGQTLLSDVGKGRGLTLNSGGPDLEITRTDGVVLNVNLDAAKTIQDVINAIRNHPQNTGSKRLLVNLNDNGNGIQLKAPPDTRPLQVRQLGVSNAGVRLGLIPSAATASNGVTVGPVNTIVGSDFALRDAGGAIDTLLRLETAVRDGDTVEIERLQKKLDLNLDTATRARGKIGVWSRNLDQLKEVSEDNVTQLRSHLSEEIDADFATVISDLSQRQLALQASMRLIGQTAQMTVLNYL